MQMHSSETQRLFVAVWPDRTVRNRLAELQTELKLSEYGRLTPASNFHITLQFLGDVSSDEVRAKQTFVENFKFQPFTLQIDRAGSWPRNEVAWVGSSIPCPEINELANSIKSGLRDSEKNTKEFVPHITLARKVRRKIHAEIQPIRLQVNRVDLVRSVLSHQGAQYESIAHSG